MRRIYSLIGVSLLFASLGAATDWSTMEGFVGYNFVHFNPNSNYVPSFNANGGSGQFVYNFTPWIGAAVDIGAVNKGVLNQYPINTTVMDFVGGPRFTFHNHSRFLPFAQVLFGGAYATTSAPIAIEPNGVVTFPPGVFLNPNQTLGARITASNTGFAMLAGGGLDIKISKHVAFRPIGVDYYLTRIPSFLTGNTSNRNNFRYSAGVNFLFGAK